MKKAELLKLAKENKEVADALLTITKSAAEQTNFDESVPAVGDGQVQGATPAPVGPAAQPAVGAPAGAGAIPADQAALEMTGQGQGMIDPAEEGARAARAFLAPAFEAAAQGDPNAQQTLAIAAGEVAKGVAMAANQSTGEQMPQPPIVTPEEQVADQIVAAPTQAKANAKPEVEEKEDEEKENGKDKTDKKPPFEKKSELVFSADTVKGLIQLAKANII